MGAPIVSLLHPHGQHSFEPDRLRRSQKNGRFVPVRAIMKDPFPSLYYAGVISAPIHLIHGRADEIIPAQQARPLMAAFPQEQAGLTEVRGYGHSDIDQAILGSAGEEPFCALLRN